MMASGNQDRSQMSVSPALSGVPQDDDEDEEEVPRRLYYANGQQVTNIKIVFTPNDLKPEHSQRSFKPELIHQIFDNNGVIYGYRNLSIDIYYLANSAKCFVDLKHTEIVNPSLSGDHARPDDIFRKLAAWLPDGYYTEKKQFLRAIRREKHTRMFGKVVDHFQTYNRLEETKYKYTITKCSTSEQGFAQFHARFQCLLVWYIDAASQIDLEDPNWMFLYIYEQRRQPNGKFGARYPVGFCTIYKFFHFPDKIRARVSQLFILPPCQNTGLGTVLLRNAYQLIQSLPNVIDITVEDPCQTFTRMRDLLDCQLLMQLDSFKYPTIKEGFTKEMFDEANLHFKLNKKQCRRIYEILRIVYLNGNRQEFDNFYREVVQRIEAPYMRDQKAVMRKKLRREQIQGNQIYQPSKPTRCVKSNVMSYLTELNEAAVHLRSKLNKCK